MAECAALPFVSVQSSNVLSGLFTWTESGVSLSFYTCLLVMFGGALGSLLRHVVSVLTAPYSRIMPWGTIFAVNTVGSFVIAFFATLTMADGRYPMSDNMRLLVMTGICGGYTTFSTFSWQTFEFLRTGAVGRALLTVILSVVMCIGAASAGYITAVCFNFQTMQAVEVEKHKDI